MTATRVVNTIFTHSIFKCFETYQMSGDVPTLDDIKTVSDHYSGAVSIHELTPGVMNLGQFPFSRSQTIRTDYDIQETLDDLLPLVIDAPIGTKFDFESDFIGPLLSKMKPGNYTWRSYQKWSKKFTSDVVVRHAKWEFVEYGDSADYFLHYPGLVPGGNWEGTVGTRDPVVDLMRYFFKCRTTLRGYDGLLYPVTDMEVTMAPEMLKMPPNEGSVLRSFANGLMMGAKHEIV
jgi:hypothetical protein